MANKVTLTEAQRSELIEQFVEIQLDNMDTQSLYELASEYVTNSFDRLTDSEIKERIESLYDAELYDELVDNVTTDKVITSQELEGDISTVKDSDYAEKVDRLVDNMGMRKYKWDEQFYNEIVKDSTFSYGKFNDINYPLHLQQQ